MGGYELASLRSTATYSPAATSSGFFISRPFASVVIESETTRMTVAKTTDGSMDHRALLVNARRVVVKVGTGVVCNEQNEFDPRQIAGMAASIAGLVKAGRQMVLVSS